MGLDVEIRLATIEDSEAIAAVLKAAFAEFEMLYTAEGFRATTPDAEQVRHRMAEGPVWVALDGDIIVGTCSAIGRATSLYIRGMAVLTSARGRKVGEQLLSHIESYARASAFNGLLLSTTPFLHKAIALYERFGFRRIASGPTELFGTALFTMEKRFDS
jgi:putative acetyltransferase